MYILNRTATGQTPNSTPYETWYGKKPNLEHARVFGSEAYVHVPDQKRTKLDPKSKKLLFVGYDNNSRNYRLFDPSTRKITISRNVLFNEKVKGFIENPNIVPIMIDENYEAPEPDVQQNLQIDEPEFNILEDNENEIPEQENPPNLRPGREIRLPSRFEGFELNIAEVEIPRTYQEALKCDEAEHWKTAINEEFDALRKNQTWDEVEPPPGKKIISSRWVFRVKRSPDGLVSRYKARLCAKGFAQEKGIDYDEIFSPTTRFDSIRVLLAITAARNYEVKQFDIKTAFL